jgi:thiamine pyrophosphate-dependent acetolactate synthase large subunit-like protein
MTAFPSAHPRHKPMPGQHDGPEPVGQLVGATLIGLGVRTVFGVAGGEGIPAARALVAGGANHHAARDEGSATAMAEGWSRAVGCVGVVSLHHGAGLTNALSALACAASSRTGLLVLASPHPLIEDAGDGASRRTDAVGLVGATGQHVTSLFSAAVDTARALRRAAEARRPVVLTLPASLPSSANQVVLHRRVLTSDGPAEPYQEMDRSPGKLQGLRNAMGVAVAESGRVTVVVLSEGTVSMALGELETAARLRLRLLVIIYHNAAGPREPVVANRTALAPVCNADVPALARACGTLAVTVRSGADLAAVGDWVRRGVGALVLDARVDIAVCVGWVEDVLASCA